MSTLEKIKALESNNQYLMAKISQNNVEIHQIRAVCQHDFRWLNDPYFHTLHECRHCGHQQSMEIVIKYKSKI